MTLPKYNIGDQVLIKNPDANSKVEFFLMTINDRKFDSVWRYSAEGVIMEIENAPESQLHTVLI